MRTPHFVVSIGLVMMAVAGCGGGDPISRMQSTYNSLTDYACRSCPGAAGAASESDCRMLAATNNPFNGPEWDCQREAYNRYPNELGPTYDCTARAVSSYDSCMRTAIGNMCPPTSAEIGACNTQLNAAIEACPRTDSIAAGTAVAACYE